MRPGHRGLIVTVAGATLLALGIAFAVAGAPKRRPRPAPKPAAGELDCKLLQRQLVTCSVQIASALDPELATRLAAQPAPLPAVLRRSITQEFLARVANPCFQRKGKLAQGAALQACVQAAADQVKDLPCPKAGDGKGSCQAWRTAQQCAPLAACLKQKIGALPAPKAPRRPAPATKP